MSEEQSKVVEFHKTTNLTNSETVIAARYKIAAENSAATKSLLDKLGKMRRAREIAIDAHEAAMSAARASGVGGGEYVVGSSKYRAHGKESLIFQAVAKKIGPAEQAARAALKAVTQERDRIAAERWRKFDAAAKDDGSERRAVIRSMKDPDRRAMLSKVARDSDLATCASLFGSRADEVTLGVDAAYLASLREVVVKRFDGDALALESELIAVEEAAEKFLGETGRWLMEFGGLGRVPQVKAAELAQAKLDELAAI
jgi:hypothetical protein